MTTADLEPPEPEAAGVTCCKCRTQLMTGELYGVLDGRVLCGQCVDEEWMELTAEEKLEILGFEVEGLK